MNAALIGFCGVILGGLISYLITNFMSKKATDVDLINNQMDQVSKLESYALDYWLNDGEAVKDSNDKSAALVNGAMTAGSYFEEHAVRIMSKLQYATYTRLDGELFDLVTGGTFETAEKAVDCERVVEIMAKCNEVRGFLAMARRSMFGAQ
jgi:hypothetical protein